MSSTEPQQTTRLTRWQRFVNCLFYRGILIVVGPIFLVIATGGGMAGLRESWVMLREHWKEKNFPG